MKNLLMSSAIGDIAGSAYEGRSYRIKDYGKVKMFSSHARFTDDTVLTFACAEAFIHHIDMGMNIWMRGNQYKHAGFGHAFKDWLRSDDHKPYGSLGDGSAMRCSSAGWLAKSEEECIQLATETALPTHNHPEGINGAVATALTIYWLNNGKEKEFVKENVLKKYYPDWADLKYSDFHDSYRFSSKCPDVIGPAIISFLGSKDYVDCLRLAISLGGDADTLAAIAGPMAYAYYKTMPEGLITKALDMLPDWMRRVNNEFDEYIAANNPKSKIQEN